VGFEARNGTRHGPIFAVRPRKVIAVDATPGKFQGSATRWLFEEGGT
jgi:hypothetical protein